ncbi:hypothetical protein BDP27DRAFT_1370855 [Rhodocollybia butyracea]|uniref:Uncharacterized protein n=1 Tax=Rhodocollybia butyracea TaxID=206335 RepID=A0A9P5P8A2_9AGAR|nr:hypothetical protein BDP27DRAFT_1370855 [Rhodocollybia butyracea]
MADDTVKCPFCREQLNESQLHKHIKLGHKTATSLYFYVDSVGQTMDCPSADNQKAFGCPVRRIDQCTFSAEPLELFKHIQTAHKALPMWYRDVAGYKKYPLDFLDRPPREKNREPLRLPAPALKPVENGTVSHPRPTSLVVIDLDSLPIAFETYARSQEPGTSVTTSEVLDFFMKVPGLIQEYATSTRTDGPPTASPTRSPVHRVVTPLSPKGLGLQAPLDNATFSGSPRLSPRRSKVSSQSSSPKVIPPPRAPISREIFDPTCADNHRQLYVLPSGETVPYRELQEAPWVFFVRIPLGRIAGFQFSNDKGPKAVFKRVAFLQNDFAGVCVYHTVLNQGSSCLRDTFHCSGPMSGQYCDYYLHFKQVMKLPGNTCAICYCPFDKDWGPTFKHPIAAPGFRCQGRERFQDLYRGLVYIIFRCSPLRKAVFEWLGDATLADQFVSTTDWARWLVMPASTTFSRLVNFYVVVWALLELWEAKGLPKHKMEFDDVENDPALFSVIQYAKKAR